MPTQHTVQQGEDLFSISRMYGVPADKIESHGPNKSLWESSRDNEILAPGDSLEIPDIEQKKDSGSTGSRASFKFKSSAKSKIKIRLEDIDGPRANIDYVLNVEGKEIQGQSDGDGCIEADVPVDATSAVLHLTEEGESYDIEIGHLNPVESISGAMQRLKHLCYYLGDIGDAENDEFLDALRRFQIDQELTDSGELDKLTQDKLVEVHQC